MDKVRIGIIFLSALCLATVAGSASLAATTFGFPVIVHSGQSVAFSNDFASSTDHESLNFDFPQFNDLMASSGTPQMSLDNGPSMGMSPMEIGQMGTLFDLSSFKFF